MDLAIFGIREPCGKVYYYGACIGLQSAARTQSIGVLNQDRTDRNLGVIALTSGWM